MIAKINAEGTDEAGQVTISLRNGKVLKADFGESSISITENTTGVDEESAKHVAGVAWAIFQDEASAISWDRLLDRASKVRKGLEAKRFSINLSWSIVKFL